jgi:hypothetical protein
MGTDSYNSPMQPCESNYFKVVSLIHVWTDRYMVVRLDTLQYVNAPDVQE